MRIRRASWLTRVGVFWVVATTLSWTFPASSMSRDVSRPSEFSRPKVQGKPFTKKELARLSAGKSVKRRFDIMRGDLDYRAGFSYRLIEATPMEVMQVLRRPDGIRRSIPYGLEATTLREENGVAQVRIVQGKKPITGEYTVRMEWDMSDYSARFWMDPSFDHDIVDIWGVFSAREVRPGWTLVSFGFAFNIGGVGEIIENKAQGWALSTADRIARLVEGPQASSSSPKGPIKSRARP